MRTLVSELQRAARLVGVCAPIAAICCGSAELGPSPDGRFITDARGPVGFTAGPVADTAPAENPLTEARAQLGKRLFYDPVLSRDRTISCSTCHQQSHAFADPRAVSAGVDNRAGTRNAPALVNLAWATSLFWDGRAKTLEEQVGQPIENPIEMDLGLTTAVARLASDVSYREQFLMTYSSPPSVLALESALASFVRTLVSGESPYDHHLAGDLRALNESALRGESLFLSERGGCFHCHPAGSLTNDGFFNNGTFISGGDAGRQLVTGRPGDLGKFRVPGLRNVATSAPYMHDGSLATLEDVVTQYAAGGRGHPSTDPQISRRDLSSTDQQDLLAFLHALTDATFLADERLRP
jgi:cytochrome c peroxidase